MFELEDTESQGNSFHWNTHLSKKLMRHYVFFTRSLGKRNCTCRLTSPKSCPRSLVLQPWGWAWPLPRCNIPNKHPPKGQSPLNIATAKIYPMLAMGQVWYQAHFREDLIQFSQGPYELTAISVCIFRGHSGGIKRGSEILSLGASQSTSILLTLTLGSETDKRTRRKWRQAPQRGAGNLALGGHPDATSFVFVPPCSSSHRY